MSTTRLVARGRFTEPASLFDMNLAAPSAALFLQMPARGPVSSVVLAEPGVRATASPSSTSFRP